MGIGYDRPRMDGSRGHVSDLPRSAVLWLGVGRLVGSGRLLGLLVVALGCGVTLLLPHLAL